MAMTMIATYGIVLRPVYVFVYFIGLYYFGLGVCSVETVKITIQSLRTT